MSFELADKCLKRQSKIFKKWGPWDLPLHQTRDLLAYVWGFQNWGEFVALKKRKYPIIDHRVRQLCQDTLDPELRENLIVRHCCPVNFFISMFNSRIH